MHSVKAAGEMPCEHCGKDARQGVMISLRGPGTGYNTEHHLLCSLCAAALRTWLSEPDAVAPVAVSEAQHRLFAERFARKGLAQ